MIEGVRKTGFFMAFGRSLFITVCSVAVIVLFTSMTAWYITRVKTKLYSVLYYVFVFAMICAVPDGHVHHVEDGQ